MNLQNTNDEAWWDQYDHRADYVNFNQGDNPSFYKLSIIEGIAGIWWPPVISVLPFCSFLPAIIYQQYIKNECAFGHH